MSLHRYIVPPPLALAVHPAPAPTVKPKVDEKDKEKAKGDDKVKADDKGKLAGDDKDPKIDKAKVEPELPQDQGKGDKAPIPFQAIITPPDSPAASSSPESPLSPASNIPEPPTPGPDAPKPLVGVPAPKENKKKKRKAAAAAAAAKAADAKALPTGEATPAPTSPSDDKGKDAPAATVPEKPAEPLPPFRLLCPAPPRPLRTKLDLDPARPYPPIHIDPRGAYHKYAKAVQGEVIYVDITKDGWLVEQWRGKTEREALERLTGEADRQRQREVDAKLRENLIRPVPPSAEGLIKELWNDLVLAPANEIAVDAFWSRYDWNDHAAGLHAQLASDGMKKKWEEQRAAAVKAKEEKAEKAKKEREAAKAADAKAKESGDQKARDSSDAKEAGKNDDKVKVFDKAAEQPKPEEKKDERKKDAEDHPDASTLPALERGYATEVEWTKEGVETILATVGVQCGYNTAKPISRHWSNPSGAYLLLSHGHFLLRLEQDIQFKNETTANDFEVLVTSGHDRVFGEMVKAQQAEERKKKEKEYRERKEREKREAAKKAEAKAGDGAAGAADDKDKKHKANGGEAEKKDDGKAVGAGGAMTPVSDVKHKDGERVIPEGAAAVGVTNGENAVAVIAVPAKNGDEAQKQTLDEEHEADAKVVGPIGGDTAPAVAPAGDGNAPAVANDAKVAEAKEDGAKDARDRKDAKDVKAEKDAKDAQAKAKAPPKEPRPAFDQRDIDLLVKLMGPEVAQLPMAELKMAFAAVEAAAQASATKDAALTKEDGGPVIWTWNEPCEKWRWKNYAAGCAVMEEGCWEERDWKVFPDGGGCDEFDTGEEWMEKVEEDLYDWSC